MKVISRVTNMHPIRHNIIIFQIKRGFQFIKSISHTSTKRFIHVHFLATTYTQTSVLSESKPSLAAIFKKNPDRWLDFFNVEKPGIAKTKNRCRWIFQIYKNWTLPNKATNSGGQPLRTNASRITPLAECLTKGRLFIVYKVMRNHNRLWQNRFLFGVWEVDDCYLLQMRLPHTAKMGPSNPRMNFLSLQRRDVIELLNNIVDDADRCPANGKGRIEAQKQKIVIFLDFVVYTAN